MTNLEQFLLDNDVPNYKKVAKTLKRLTGKDLDTISRVRKFLGYSFLLDQLIRVGLGMKNAAILAHTLCDDWDGFAESYM